MLRLATTPRSKWQEKVEKIGFGFHTTNVPYWDESAYYSFTLEEVLQIEKATSQLWEICLEAVQHVIDEELFDRLGIPDQYIAHIKRSWNEDAPAIYGRFDFGYKDGVLKMFEFNADTPTSLFEASIVQWYWLKDFDTDKDQFNSMHEKLVAYWTYLKGFLHDGPLHFTAIKKSLEDLTTVEYMRDCAIQGGLDTKLVFIDDIGWDVQSKVFLDMEETEIKNIFKLYPWEWMAREDFGQNILIDANRALWIEPSWKMILSNKGILPLLWELFPRSPYVLECYRSDENKLKDYVRKPLLSREGANVQIVRDGRTIEATKGEYGDGPSICQALFDLPNFDGNRPVIGSWIIGQEAAGMGIREANSLITNNTSRFIPHLING